MHPTATARRFLLALSLTVLAALVAGCTSPAANPTTSDVPATPEVLFELPEGEPCLKGLGNCVVYPKATQLPSGRMLATFEYSKVGIAPDGLEGAAGQTLPIWKSDDDGTTWQKLTDVEAPAFISADAEAAPYTSNWTNPNFYVLPEDVGNLEAGTVLLASVVSGEDAFFRENKAADPDWVPDNDGDRQDMAIALFAGSPDGSEWQFVNIVARGGWQGGSAGAGGQNVAAANAFAQVDPVWEPQLFAWQGQLVAYYSDENDYLGFDPETGIAALDPANDTAPDARSQVLVHRTWDGSDAPWSEPVVDVPGETFEWNGQQQIGGGRPGMTTIAPTTDGQFLITFEYWAGGADTRYKLSSDPLAFYADASEGGEDVRDLPLADGSHWMAAGGSPVLASLGDGRIVYNAAGESAVWVGDGSSTGEWVEFDTPIAGGYSRNLTPIAGTDRVLILQSTWDGPTTTPIIRFVTVDVAP